MRSAPAAKRARQLRAGPALRSGPGRTAILAVLRSATRYDAFRFFASGPPSPFVAFTASDGDEIVTGDTIVRVIPEPGAILFFSIGAAVLGLQRRR